MGSIHVHLDVEPFLPLWPFKKETVAGDGVVADVENDPVIVFASVTRGGLPVIGASAKVEIFMPGEAAGVGSIAGDSQVYQMNLHDDGLGKWSHINSFKNNSEMPGNGSFNA